MSNTKNTITINGRTYDTRTGAPVKDVVAPVVTHVPKKPAAKQPNKPVFQDVIGPVVIRPTKPRPTPIIEEMAIKPASEAKAARKHHATTAHKVHASSQKAATLMRHVVHKPTFVKASPAQQAIYATSKPKVVAARKITSDPSPRVERAQAIPQSKLISKFSTSNQIANIVKRAEVLSVKQQPAAHTQAVKKIATQPTHQLAQTTPAEDLFMKVIANANSHTQPHVDKPKHAKRSRRLGKRALVNIGASLLIVALVGGFFTYQAMPKLAMRSITKQAGITAAVPHFAPSGFAMQKPTSPSPGTVVLNFRSRGDGRNYTISQQKSSLDSETLRDNVSNSSQQSYQTYESSGQMIYVYSTNATWVKNGIQYTIEGNSSLTTDQVLRIAASF